MSSSIRVILWSAMWLADHGLGDHHQSGAKFIDQHVQQRQLAIVDAAEQPDYNVLVAIAAYFVGFPDRCHHPKEDLIYRKMRVRNPALAQTMTDLEAEHEDISPLAHQFWESVQSVLQGAEISRSAFYEVARRFVRVQRRHMQMEEEHFFPLAQQILTPHDWAEIDERITREEDPVFGGKVPQVFAALRDDILKWEAEDEAQEV